MRLLVALVVVTTVLFLGEGAAGKHHNQPLRKRRDAEIAGHDVSKVSGFSGQNAGLSRAGPSLLLGQRTERNRRWIKPAGTSQLDSDKEVAKRRVKRGPRSHGGPSGRSPHYDTARHGSHTASRRSHHSARASPRSHGASPRHSGSHHTHHTHRASPRPAGSHHTHRASPRSHGASVRDNAAAPTADCTDLGEHCAYWASTGECSRRADYMLQNCRLSCGVCGGASSSSTECKDNVEDCIYWASDGECNKNPDYMTLHCRRSCGVCGGAALSSTGCTDNHKDCASWASTGECARNEDYMLTVCRRSCNTDSCATQEPEVEVPNVDVGISAAIRDLPESVGQAAQDLVSMVEEGDLVYACKRIQRQGVDIHQLMANVALRLFRLPQADLSAFLADVWTELNQNDLDNVMQQIAATIGPLDLPDLIIRVKIKIPNLNLRNIVLDTGKGVPQADRTTYVWEIVQKFPSLDIQDLLIEIYKTLPGEAGLDFLLRIIILLPDLDSLPNFNIPDFALGLAARLNSTDVPQFLLRICVQFPSHQWTGLPSFLSDIGNTLSDIDLPTLLSELSERLPGLDMTDLVTSVSLKLPNSKRRTFLAKVVLKLKTRVHITLPESETNGQETEPELVQEARSQSSTGNGCQCKVKGNSQFTTFDGARFKLTSSCSYLMASSTEVDPRCAFSVTVRNQKTKKNKISVRLLEVTVGQDVIRLDQGPAVYVNGRAADVPMERAGYKIRRTGSSVAVITSCGVKVEFDGKKTGKIVAPRKKFRPSDGYPGLVGLCGDCDGQRGNDLLVDFEGEKVRSYQNSAIQDFSRQFLVLDNSGQESDDPQCVLD